MTQTNLTPVTTTDVLQDGQQVLMWVTVRKADGLHVPEGQVHVKREGDDTLMRATPDQLVLVDGPGS